MPPTPSLTVGLPRHHAEQGERRDYLPSLIAFLDRLGASEIVLEHFYGSGLCLTRDHYLEASPRVRFAPVEECLRQDLVLALRCPGDDALARLKPGAVLVAMLHLDTRPARARLLRGLELHAISLDLVRDDLGRRLVENLEAVATNGVREACRQLQKRLPGFATPARGRLRATVLGAGAVGAHAARAAVAYGNPSLRHQLHAAGVPGVEVTLIDFELAADAAYVQPLLRGTHLLIDATRRPSQSQVVIPNAWLAELPEHAVVLDLTADPYDFSQSPASVKAIEGVPHGNLDQYVFQPGDPAFAALDPRVAHAHQRTSLSCYSWPGVDPLPCMHVYSKQIEPVLRAVFERGVRGLDPAQGTWAERATARGSLQRWEAAP